MYPIFIKKIEIKKDKKKKLVACYLAFVNVN